MIATFQRVRQERRRGLCSTEHRHDVNRGCWLERRTRTRIFWSRSMRLERLTCRRTADEHGEVAREPAFPHSSLSGSKSFQPGLLLTIRSFRLVISAELSMARRRSRRSRERRPAPSDRPTPRALQSKVTTSKGPSRSEPGTLARRRGAQHRADTGGSTLKSWGTCPQGLAHLVSCDPVPFLGKLPSKVTKLATLCDRLRTPQLHAERARCTVV